MKCFRLGTRSSPLARVQAEWVALRLRNQGIECEVVPIRSGSDLESDRALYTLDSIEQGVFTKELERALSQSQVDAVVHSLKDLPTVQPTGLEVVAVPRREDSADVLITHQGRVSGEGPVPLASNTIVGTSSLRREAQVLAARSDLFVKSIRGNIATRLEKLQRGEYGAIIMAQAALNRLGADVSAFRVIRLPFVSAPGQGALAIEMRCEGDASLRTAVKGLNHADSYREVCLERRVLSALEGGCSLPLGVRVCCHSDRLELKAFLGVVEPSSVRAPTRQWLRFETFDVSSTDERILVSETVAYFKGVLEGDS